MAHDFLALLAPQAAGQPQEAEEAVSRLEQWALSYVSQPDLYLSCPHPDLTSTSRRPDPALTLS
jgi:hypothetical protein|eukprot:COSAG06_NODE_14728_length_1131_cov_0.751938_1_plen_64_part_00